MDAENIMKLAQGAENIVKLAQMTRREGAFDDATGPAEWPAPDMSLLGAEIPEPPLFTDELLPPAAARWVRETTDKIAAPQDYLAGSLLAYASAAFGNARWASPTPDYKEPPHLWFGLVGVPSSGKTPAMLPVVNAAASLEADDEPAFAEVMQNYERDASRAKAVYDVWQGEIKTAVKNGSPAPDMPADAIPPDMPVRPRLKVAESTVQELGAILGGNPKGLLLIRDELTGLLGSMDQYGGHGADRAFYLECWNGGPYVVDRRKHSGTPIRIPHASLAILGGIQPERLKEALAGADDGLAARFLFIWPDPVQYRDLTILSYQERTASEARAKQLVTAGQRLRSLHMGIGERGEPVPVLLELSPEAFDLLNDIRRVAHDQSRSSRGLAAGWHGKTPARALRLALVFEFLEWALGDDRTPAPTVISAKSMEYAGNFLEYAGDMLDRVLAGFFVEQSDADARPIAEMLIAEKPEIVNERALSKRQGFHILRTTDRRAAAFRVLEAAGFVRPKVAKGPGRHPANWLVNPNLGGAR
jgi:Protein of unknown function (DUF3987)